MAYKIYVDGNFLPHSVHNLSTAYLLRNYWIKNNKLDAKVVCLDAKDNIDVGGFTPIDVDSLSNKELRALAIKYEISLSYRDHKANIQKKFSYDTVRNIFYLINDLTIYSYEEIKGLVRV